MSIRQGLRKAVCCVPSIITGGNMAFGLLSILASCRGEFTHAAWLLVGAMFCDIMDGRVARLTHTTSEFGAQLDSLGDLVSFGVAPALMIYMLALQGMGAIGVAITALFVLCSGARLARFNVAANNGEVCRFFTGLPTPASAGLLISFILSYELLEPAHAINIKSIPILMQTMPAFFKASPVIMVVLSFLMVSNIPYYSFKHMKLSRVRMIPLAMVGAALVLLILMYPQNVFFLIFFTYAVSGILMYLPASLLGRRRRRLEELEEDVLDEDEDVDAEPAGALGTVFPSDR